MEIHERAIPVSLQDLVSSPVFLAFHEVQESTLFYAWRPMPGFMNGKNPAKGMVKAQAAGGKKAEIARLAKK